MKSRLQADVDELYAQFVQMVSTRRGCSPETIRATEAAVFRGQHAVNVGMADAVGTLQQAHNELAASFETGELVPSPEGKTPPALAPVPAPESALHTKLDALSAIVAQAKRLGVAVDPLTALRNGTSPDALRQQVLQQAAERDAAEDVVSTAPAERIPAQNQNPLLTAVKALCAKGAN